MDDNPTRRRLLQTGGGLGALALAGCSELPALPWNASGPDAWPMYRFDAANTGSHAGAGPGDSMAVGWTVDATSLLSDLDEEFEVAHCSSPVVADGTVFVSVTATEPTVGLHLVALKAETGSVQWRTRAREEFAQSGIEIPQPAFVDGTVILAAYPLFADDDPVVAFDAASGEEAWRYRGAGKPTTAGAIVGDQLVFGGFTALSVGVDGSDGWHFEAKHPDTDETVYSQGRPPAAGDGTIVVPAREMFFAIDENGETQWSRSLEFTTEQGSLITSTRPYPPVVGDETVYVVTGDHDRLGDGRLLGVDPADGTMTWEFKPAFDEERRQQLVDEFTNESAGVYPSLNVGVYGTPALRNGTLYVPGYTLPEADQPESVPRLFAIDAESGEKQWSSDLEDPLPASPGPVVADGTVYVAAGPGIVAFDGDSGDELGTVSLDLPPERFAIVEDSIYASDRASVYAIESAGTPTE